MTHTEQGDLSRLTAFIPFSEEDDILRFRIFLSHQVDCKNLTNFPGNACNDLL